MSEVVPIPVRLIVSEREFAQIELGLLAIRLRPPLTGDGPAILSALRRIETARLRHSPASPWLAQAPSPEEAAAQGHRCSCRGADDLCVCQNMVWRPPA